MADYLCTFPVTGYVEYRIEADSEVKAKEKAEKIVSLRAGSHHPQMIMGDELSDAVNPYFNDSISTLYVTVDKHANPEIQEETQP